MENFEWEIHYEKLFWLFQREEVERKKKILENKYERFWGLGVGQVVGSFVIYFEGLSSILLGGFRKDNINEKWAGGRPPFLINNLSGLTMVW